VEISGERIIFASASSGDTCNNGIWLSGHACILGRINPQALRPILSKYTYRYRCFPWRNQPRQAL